MTVKTIVRLLTLISWVGLAHFPPVAMAEETEVKPISATYFILEPGVPVRPRSFAIQRGEVKGPIQITLADAPKGVRLEPATVQAGKDETALKISAAKSAALGAYRCKLVFTAGKETFSHPAEIKIQEPDPLAPLFQALKVELTIADKSANNLKVRQGERMLFRSTVQYATQKPIQVPKAKLENGVLKCGTIQAWLIRPAEDFVPTKTELFDPKRWEKISAEGGHGLTLGSPFVPQPRIIDPPNIRPINTADLEPGKYRFLVLFLPTEGAPSIGVQNVEDINDAKWVDFVVMPK